MAKYGMWGDLSVVVLRITVSICAASLLWYGFERPILRLKKHFVAKAVGVERKEATPVLVPAD